MCVYFFNENATHMLTHFKQLYRQMISFSSLCALNLFKLYECVILFLKNNFCSWGCVKECSTQCFVPPEQCQCWGCLWGWWNHHFLEVKWSQGAVFSELTCGGQATHVITATLVFYRRSQKKNVVTKKDYQ